MSETPILRRIMLALGSLPGIRVFRNNVGNAYAGTPMKPFGGLLKAMQALGMNPDRVLILRDYRRIQFGLMTGSGDLVGWRTVTITPEMVGRQIAQIVSVEVKTETGRTSMAQRTWAARVNEAGGVAGVARNESDAINLIYGGDS
jgi:hypothetical protein